jgi:hypothetical protein
MGFPDGKSMVDSCLQQIETVARLTSEFEVLIFPESLMLHTLSSLVKGAIVSICCNHYSTIGFS